MKNQIRLTRKLNAGTGMAMGTLIGAAIALIVHVLTGDGSIWIWAIPNGLATGLAIGVSAANKNDSETKKELL